MKYKDVKIKFRELHTAFNEKCADDSLYDDFMNSYYDTFDCNIVNNDMALDSKDYVFLIKYLFTNYINFAKEYKEELIKQKRLDEDRVLIFNELRDLVDEIEELK